MSQLQRELQKATEIIAGADALVIGAGAGMGVDSGLPDFRGNDGFWRAYPALARSRLSFVEVANTQTFTRDLGMAWGFYGHRLQLYRKTEPHGGFGILKKWMRGKVLGGRIYTSNVDGQFQKAGFAEDDIHEIHGSIHHMQCMDGCRQDIWSAEGFNPEVDELACRLLNAPPRCSHCGGPARPNILMFGDWGWLNQRSRRQADLEQLWLDRTVGAMANLAVIEIGAGTAIPSVRHFSQHLIREYGARLIRINVRDPQVPSDRDVGLPMGGLEALSRIEQTMQAMEEGRLH